MIVKNERHVIERSLTSAKPIIDYWVIVDTGSTDGTQEFIKEVLKDIPGELYERPWKNFAHNRTEALNLAKDKSDYILMMDADDWFEYGDGFALPPLTADAYQVWWHHQNDCSYLKPQLIKSSLPWKWVGVLHEYLTCGAPCKQATLEDVIYRYGANGARSKDPEKYKKDAMVLEEGLKDEPHNSRYMFYLAESYKNSGETEKAIEAYTKTTTMNGWNQEKFWAYLQCALLKYDLKRPIEEVITDLYSAHRTLLHRPEPIYFLAEIYNQTQRYDEAYELIQKWDRAEKPKTKDILFNLNWTEDYGIDLQKSLAAYYLNNFKECLNICNKLLDCKKLPENWRAQVKINQSFALQKIQEGGSNLIVDDKRELVAEIINNEPVKNATKSVFIAILARNKEHVLPTFLKCIDNQTYDKKLITLYFNTNDNCDNTEEILKSWIHKHENLYHKIIFESHETKKTLTVDPHAWDSERWNVLGNLRKKSLDMAKEEECDFYFVVDCDNFIIPETLSDLVAKDKPIIAPLLRGVPQDNDLYSNFFCDVTENGYYKDHPSYFKILNRQKLGVFKVPVVHQAYLVKTEFADQLSYVNEVKEWEFIIFSRSAREHNVDQYICNEKPYGTFLHFPSGVTLEEEKKIFEEIVKYPGVLKCFPSSNSGFQKLSLPSFWNDRNELEKKIKECQEKLAIGINSEDNLNALIEIAHAEDRLNKPEEEVIESYRRAYHYAPSQVDPIFFLTKYLREHNRAEEAYKLAVEGVKLLSFENKKESFITQQGMLWEFSLCAHYLGRFQEAIDATRKLLNSPLVSLESRKILKKNLTYYIPGVDIFAYAKKKWGPGNFTNISKASQKKKLDIPYNPSPKLHICSMASDWNENLDQLVKSAGFFNLKIDVIGIGESFSFGKRLKEYKKYLSSIPENDVVLFVDAYDILILGDEKTILEKFTKLNIPMLFQAEQGCHPFPHLAPYFSHNSRFKYLNAGSYIGYAGPLKELLEKMEPIDDSTDDQGLLTVYFLYHPDELYLDYECDLFLSLYKVEEHELEVDTENKKLFCSTEKTIPCIIHGNGSGKGAYQKIYDRLFKS